MQSVSSRERLCTIFEEDRIEDDKKDLAYRYLILSDKDLIYNLGQSGFDK